VPNRAGKLTDFRELGAYVIAHGIGKLCGNTIRWWISANLPGFQGSFAVQFFVPEAALIVAVLLLFLTLRRGMGARGAPREAFSAPHEIEIYLIAHAIGLLFTFLLGVGAYALLYSWGFRSWAGTIVTIVTDVVVLLIFLFVRRRVMAIR
jgi:ABC-type multidrug transport system permease subunit